MDKIPLADMLIELRSELNRAQQAGEGQALRFRIETIDLELQITVTEGDEVSAGFKFWVVNGDAKSQVTAQSLHKLHLKLNPVTVDPDDPQGGAKPLEVSGDRAG